VDFYNPSTP